MTVVALTNFFEATDSDGVVQARYQNSKPGEAIRHRGADYYYLPFIYQGATVTRTGDNLEAAMVLAVNELALNNATAAVRGHWNVRMDSCSMNPKTFEVAKLLTTETWIAASMSYDVESVEVLLSSSIDAVGSNAPQRVLTRAMVGSLPVTASIQNR